MKTILITEDKVEVRELVKVTLNIGEYKILEADNGEDAVAIARQEHPDLILMDVMMPGNIDGLEATRRIKRDPETQSCRIVMLTARGQQHDKEAGFSAGADGYFTKPFSPLELIQQVEAYLK